MLRTPSEVKERHAYIDRSLENTVDILRSPEATKILGDMAAQRASYIENNYVVPNIRNGQISLSSVSDNQIPIVTIATGESLGMGSQFQQQTTSQRLATRRFFTGDSKNTEADRVIDQLIPNLGEGRVTIGTANAMVGSLSDTFDLAPLYKSSKPMLYLLHARPFMVLNYLHNAYRVNPSTIVHETEHVIQHQRNPIYEAPPDGDWSDIRLRTELAAYHIQALTLKAMQDMGYYPQKSEYLPVREITPQGEYISDIIIIDRIRRRANAARDDKYYPDPAIKDRLAKLGLASMYTSTTGGEIL